MWGGGTMAGRFSKAELKKKLHKSVFHIAATEGIEKLTVRKVSAGCNLSDPYLYQCYSDIPELLRAAFLEIDEGVAEGVARVIKSKQIDMKDLKSLERACWVLWNVYWKYLMQDADRTVFYWRYYQSGYYTKELYKHRLEKYSTFVNFLNEIGENTGISEKIDVNVIAIAIIDGTVGMAVNTHRGGQKMNSIKIKTIYYSVFAFAYKILGIDFDLD